MENDNLKIIDDALRALVAEKLTKSRELPLYDTVETDSFGEVVDKLVITHIRYWMLEDLMSGERNDGVLAGLRRKSERLFKRNRPMLVQALDKAVYNLVAGGGLDIPVDVKLYRDW